MSAVRRPPRLLVKTLAVTFITVALLLVVVFLGVTVSVRDRVRQTVTDNLESSQRMFAALETRRQRELRAQAASLAENPTLKAALDTYVAEAGTADESFRSQLLATVTRELDKLAARVEADAIVVVDARQNILQAAGRLADRWPRGRRVTLVGATDNGSASLGEYDGVVQMSSSRACRRSRRDGSSQRDRKGPRLLLFVREPSSALERHFTRLRRASASASRPISRCAAAS